MSERTRFLVGEPTFLASESASESVGVIFEDDGETGYFYALRLPENDILDAVQIYNVSAVADRDRHCEAEIVWSQDGLKAALLIERHPHAVFDFSATRGYCRTNFPNFPEPDETGWRKDDHTWHDSVMIAFQR